MDAADFWHQARAPFGQQDQQQGLNQHHQLQHHPHGEPPPPQHEHLINASPIAATNNNNNSPQLSSKLESSQLQQHQQQQQHQHQHQHQHPLLQSHVEQSSFGGEPFGAISQQSAPAAQLSNHHLLFNAAAAAAAAAHLKSTALHNSASDVALPLHNPINVAAANAGLGIKPKQEHDQQQQQSGQHQQQHPDPASYATDFFGSNAVGGNSTVDSDAGTGATVTTTDQEHGHPQQQQQPGSGGQAQQPRSPGSKPSQGSPQHSITPSGGSSTPDIKYNNDKLANEIQLQLSRSSSAAAISERTLEECWSTLQRLFMHKSAMQQIQQQIPRVGLGTHGVPGATSLGGGTPGADTKPHQCQQCMKSFSSNHQLVQHIRVHTGEKPYKCSYCDRRFKQLSHVQQHTRLHTGERPYKCHLPDCGRAFIQLSNLQQHLRNHDAQVERAKNRPFHCNICGKGFATESSLRTHTSKELQLHLGVLQQHAALIGGPNATSCPVCHKLFLGTEALVDHMKHVHKEKSPPPSGAAVSQFGEVIHGGGGGGGAGVGSGANPSASQCVSESSCGQIPQHSHPSATAGSNLNDSYLGKRRTANHPCPVCGKHYVNEGSLRKHLACHAENSQLTNSLRMWPCSVCQAVFTHENGLLTHMDSMRMDPKHQFAAQYVLSRAAAEQRERESILAATLAAGGGIGEARNLLPIGANNPGGSKCPSPSANSECSSNGRLSSSSASEHDHDQDHEHGLSENENSSHNNNNNNNSNRHNIANTNNNNICTNNNNHNNNNNNNNNNNCGTGKMNELRLPSANQYTMDTDLHVANRMSLMAAAAAAVGVDAPAVSVPSAAVQAAVVNLAAAMRMNNPSNGSSLVSHSTHSHAHPHAALQHQQHHGEHPHAHAHPYHPHHHHHLHQQQQQQQQQQQVSHSVNSNSRRSPSINVPNMNINMNAMTQQHHQASASNYSQHAIAPSSQVQSQPHHAHHHHPETSLRMHQQAEAILRSHTEAAFRLAASGGVKNESDQTPATASSSSNFGSSSQQQEQTASNPSSS